MITALITIMVPIAAAESFADIFANWWKIAPNVPIAAADGPTAADMQKPTPPYKAVTIGTPGVSFHQVANMLAVRGLEQLGYTVTIVDQLPHRDMYPMFTGANGTTISIDMVTGADLPYNHAEWLEPYISEYAAVGTMNEATDIIVSVTAGAGVTTVSELGNPPTGFIQTLIGLDEDTCPACVTNGNEIIASVPGMEDYTYEAYNSSEFVKVVSAREAAGEAFAVVWYVPTYLNDALPSLSQLTGDVAPFNESNQGKTLVRYDSLHKFTPPALHFIGAVFAGNTNIVDMDVDVNEEGMSAAQAADLWISQHKDTFDMFFW